MTDQSNLGGEFTLPETSISLKRMGYGAMQLAGSRIFGPPGQFLMSFDTPDPADLSGIIPVQNVDHQPG